MRKKSRARELTLPDSRMVSMGVLSDDFATVDLREDYANLSLPKEAKFKRFSERKNNNKKALRGGKSGSRSPKRVSGDGSAPPRFRFGFPVISLFAFLWRVLVAAAHQRRRSRIKTSTRHGCKWLFRRSI